MRISIAVIISLVTLPAYSVFAQGPAALQPVVEIEEDVYTYQGPDNGSGPLWCAGSTCLVRVGDDVFASGIETLEGVKPLNNCRWTLFQRTDDGWELQQADQRGRTREPSPMVAFPDGRLFISANPTLTELDSYSGPARPEILQFEAADPQSAFETLLPAWDGEPAFTEHSYRSFAADGPNREMILFQNIGYTHAEWAFRDGQGNWAKSGKLVWPFGQEYDRPQPIRVCYPTVALADRAVHFCGVSDIVEPYDKWRAHKKKLTGRDWDYDFRRLFYTWTPDVTTSDFHPWVEIASRDKTGGWIFPYDLWVDAQGDAHILWSERAIDTRLRDAFFPDEKQSQALNYAVVRQGEVVLRRRLVLAEEGGPNEMAGAGRFHVTPGGRLFVFYYATGTDAEGKRVSENRLMELAADGGAGEPLTVPMEHPLNSYFTATVRGGSEPSTTLDLLGTRVGSSAALSYARIRLW